MTDVLVLGSGGAGLSAAVRARDAGLSVAVLTKGDLGWSATRYAQGGVAAALFEDDDSPELHGSDTLAAGGGLNDPDAVRVLAAEGPARVRELMALGAHFDRVDGTLALAREGGHSVPRVVHAGGDATGAEIERALSVAVQRSGAEVHEGWLATDLLVENGGAAGVIAVDPEGTERVLRATHTVIATGGAGQCFAVTTNPPLSTGDGVAMALRAGVAVADVEFMQFHPTALHHPSMPRPLLSEALRGEGAILRDNNGEAFMAAEHPLGDLAPRDVVARAISRRLNERGLDHLWLDATGISGFERSFPDDLASVPDRRSRPHPRLAAGGTGGALPVWWGLHRPRRRRRRFPASGRAARWRAPAFTARTAWRRTRCWRTSCSRRRVVEAIIRGKDSPDTTGVLRGIDFDTPRLGPAVGATRRRVARRSVRSSSGS